LPGRGIPGNVQAEVRVVGEVRTGHHRILHVTVAPIRPVVRIEQKTDQPVGVAHFEGELVEQARTPVAAVEVEIRRELFVLVEYVPDRSDR
jgi:hypothetical protein